jgi:excinuclease ABC subunit A
VKKTNFKTISIKGARTHNLKNIDIEIPLQKISCIYGPSGSGKSSLAFHTILAESKRRYLNSLPNDVKFFWNMPTSADVDSIYPVLPVWGLAQSNPILGSRPNLADTMGLSEHLQRLWQDFGRENCPEHRVELVPENWNDTFLALLEKNNWNGEDEVLHFFVERGAYQDKFGQESTPARSYSFEISDTNDFNEEDL